MDIPPRLYSPHMVKMLACIHLVLALCLLRWYVDANYKFLLVHLLHSEAKLVTIQTRLVSEKKLRKRQTANRPA